MCRRGRADQDIAPLAQDTPMDPTHTAMISRIMLVRGQEDRARLV